MGFRFRKSVKMGPVRVNFSKSGVGYSVGGKGFRVTKRADGKVQTTASIPGTGISYVDTVGGKKSAPAQRPSPARTAAAAPQSAPDGRKTYSIQAQQRTPQRGGGGMKGWIAGGLAALALGIGAGALLNGDEDPAPSGTLPPQVVTQVTPEVSTEPQSPEISGETEAAPEVETQPEAPAVETTPEPTPEPEPESTPSAPAVVPVAPAVTPEPEPEPVVTPEPQEKPVIGNSGTKKYHDPYCSSVDEIKASNRVEISSAEKAEAQGYVACKRCGG